MNQIVLKAGKQKPVLNRHPWIFSGAIQHVGGDPPNGAIVDVLDSHRRFLARGYLNRASQISIRLLTWDESESIDSDFFRRRLRRAFDARNELEQSPHTNAYRLCFGESDLLPGLIIDRYAQYLVLQVLTLGMEQWKQCIADLLVELLHPEGIFERSDAPSRTKEGLPSTSAALRGREPTGLVEIEENGHRFLVDIVKGQKTGFYLDQRENRQKLCAHFHGAQILNCFSYTGGFSVYAARAGARAITNVDSSRNALEIASQNMALNGLGEHPTDYVTGDVFELLRDYWRSGRTFDLIILDPPKFAMSRATVPSACRGYKDINLLAMRVLNPGGLLATFSCSSLVSADLFQKVLFGASVDARRDAQIVERFAQGPDHPVLLTFPEAAYLKGLLCRVY